MPNRRHIPPPDGLLPVIVCSVAATVLLMMAWAGLVALLDGFIF